MYIYIFMCVGKELVRCRSSRVSSICSTCMYSCVWVCVSVFCVCCRPARCIVFLYKYVFMCVGACSCVLCACVFVCESVHVILCCRSARMYSMCIYIYV